MITERGYCRQAQEWELQAVRAACECCIPLLLCNDRHPTDSFEASLWAEIVPNLSSDFYQISNSSLYSILFRLLFILYSQSYVNIIKNANYLLCFWAIKWAERAVLSIEKCKVGKSLFCSIKKVFKSRF
jgi:hypothetical protein